MALNLIKLCVGCESVEQLQDWIALRLREKQARGEPAEQFHTTRMVPKRVAELTEGGSLYWVIKGTVQCRQRLLDIRPFRDAEGVSRCHLVLEPKLVRTQFQPRRAFQGWRYLEPKDAPQDLGSSGDDAEMPLELRRELTELGLL
ncbi:MAG: lysophospholipase [Nitratireductor sp.]|nr:lysophospholipase [Nitratireductor sp.]